MADEPFTVKDYNRIIDDIIDESFTQHDIDFDMKELMKAQLLGDDEVPEGSHRMPDGSIMLDSEMGL